VKKLRKVHNDTLAQREEFYASSLQTSAVSGDAELF
jgi:hypothetical protein